MSQDASEAIKKCLPLARKCGVGKFELHALCDEIENMRHRFIDASMAAEGLKRTISLMNMDDSE